MAQYKVPQDVEADDKLLGPFSFRQFIYLMIIGGLIAIGFVLFQIFPLLIIILVPPIILLGALALPLKKDQPMETYLSAIVSYYMKPHTRIWEPGEPESTIVITAPKKVDEVHLKDISQEEATHRLSFLADIVDTEGYAIKGQSSSGVKAEVFAEANTAHDIFESQGNFASLNQNATDRHAELVNQMRDAIQRNDQMVSQGSTIISHHQGSQPIQSDYTDPQAFGQQATQPATAPDPLFQQPVAQQVSYYQPDYPITPDSYPANLDAYAQSAAEPAIPVTPVTPLPQFQAQPLPAAPNLPPPQFVEDAMQSYANAEPVAVPQEQAQAQEQNLFQTQKQPQEQDSLQVQEEAEQTLTPEPAHASEPSQDIIDLANNSDFSIETIAQQAKRINDKKDNEVYISLH